MYTYNNLKTVAHIDAEKYILSTLGFSTFHVDSNHYHLMLNIVVQRNHFETSGCIPNGNPRCPYETGCIMGSSKVTKLPIMLPGAENMGVLNQSVIVS